jgi:hypothetical protein
VTQAIVGLSSISTKSRRRLDAIQSAEYQAFGVLIIDGEGHVKPLKTILVKCLPGFWTIDRKDTFCRDFSQKTPNPRSSADMPVSKYLGPLYKPGFPFSKVDYQLDKKREKL